MPGHRATAAEVEYRVDFIYRLNIQGYRSPYAIYTFLTKMDEMSPKERAKSRNEDMKRWKPWNVSREQIDVYRETAGKRFIEAANVSQQEALGNAKEQLDDLYRRTLANEEHGNALRARRQKSEMEGLIDLTIKGGLTVELNVEPLGSRLRQKAEEARAQMDAEKAAKEQKGEQDKNSG